MFWNPRVLRLSRYDDLFVQRHFIYVLENRGTVLLHLETWCFTSRLSNINSRWAAGYIQKPFICSQGQTFHLTHVNRISCNAEPIHPMSFSCFPPQNFTDIQYAYAHLYLLVFAIHFQSSYWTDVFSHVSIDVGITFIWPVLLVTWVICQL